MVVWGAPETRHSLTSIRELLIDTPDGEPCPARRCRRCAGGAEPGQHQARRVSRYVDVGADVQGRDVDAVAAEIEQALAGIEFPLEYHAELLGEYAAAAGQPSSSFSASQSRPLIGIFLLLQAAFGSWRLAGLSFVVACRGARRRVWSRSSATAA